MVFLSSAFTLAIENGWTTGNPVARAARPKRRRHRDADPDIQFLTLSELDAVLAVIPDDVVHGEPRTETRAAPARDRPRRRMCGAR